MLVSITVQCHTQPWPGSYLCCSCSKACVMVCPLVLVGCDPSDKWPGFADYHPAPPGGWAWHSNANDRQCTSHSTILHNQIDQWGAAYWRRYVWTETIFATINRWLLYQSNRSYNRNIGVFRPPTPTIPKRSWHENQPCKYILFWTIPYQPRLQRHGSTKLLVVRC